MLMALGIALQLMFSLPRFVRQPPDGCATAVASPSPPLLRGNFFTPSGAGGQDVRAYRALNPLRVPRRKHLTQLPSSLGKPGLGSAFSDPQHGGYFAVLQPFDFKHQQYAAVARVEPAQGPFER